MCTLASKRFEEMDSYPGRSNEKTRLIQPQQHRRDNPPPPVTSSSPTPHKLPTTPMRSKQKRRKEAELPSKDYDSLDYDTCYNIPFKERLRNFTKRTYFHITLMRWFLMGVIGFLTGIVAFLIDISVKYLFQLKYGLLEKVFRWATLPYPGNGQVVLGFLVLLGFNVLFAIIASSLIALEPVAAGSGIPEIKCYLNGIKVPHVTRITTLIAKAVGVLFSVAGGFFVGKEGPMIHSGAIIGAGIPQFRSMVCKCLKLPYSYFRSDRDKRDFVSSGAAAGVAAAFGAPIGGVLFSLEEGSSFWNQSLTWRTLFCSFSSTFALNLFLSAVSGQEFGQLGSPGLVDFGVFTKNEKRLWSAYHLIIFIIMGAVGGLMGALFNSLNTRITIYRMVYLHRRRRIWRVFEAVLIIMVTTSAVFMAAMFLGTCVTNPSYIPNSCIGDDSFANETHRYYCPRYGTYYNDMATLMFNSQETAIKQLFHANGAFTLPTLGIMFIIYYFIACWTYGAGIPSGLFIPCLLIGAIYGRFVATVFGYLSSYNSYYLGFLSHLYPGTYALIGAAAFLGGVVRMTISLTVILIESTNEIDYGLPIMLTLMVAKWVGDLFNEGLYDIHIEVKQVPLLGWESPDHMDRLTAEDVMNSDLHYMFPITRVRSVERLLRTTAHSAFLIVTPVDTEAVPERPQNVSKMHTPQLYRKQSSFGVETTDIDSDTDLQTPFSVNQEPRSRTSTTSGVYPTFFPDSSITLSFNLPSHSQGVAIRSTSAYSDEKDETKPKKLLILHGIILRSQLVMMMKNRIYFHEDHGPESQPRISHLDLTADYPRYPSVFDVPISESDRDMLMDLSLYMNPSPYTISHQAPLPQVFNLFRTMGLRHLPVMKDSGIVVGIITRHDLTHKRLHEIRHHKKIEARERKIKKSPALAASITSPVDDDVFK